MACVHLVPGHCPVCHGRKQSIRLPERTPTRRQAPKPHLSFDQLAARRH